MTNFFMCDIISHHFFYPVITVLSCKDISNNLNNFFHSFVSFCNRIITRISS